MPIRTVIAGFAIAVATAAGAQAFDARSPEAVIGVLEGMEATGQVTDSGNGRVFAEIATPGGDGFTILFFDCDEAGASCEGALYATTFDAKGATLADVNALNRLSRLCRAMLEENGRPAVTFTAQLAQGMTREDIRDQVGAWQGCLEVFSAFTADPKGFLAEAAGG